MLINGTSFYDIFTFLKGSGVNINVCIVFFLLVSQIKMNNNTYDFPIAECRDQFFCMRYHNPYFTQFPFNKHFRSIFKGQNKRSGYRMHFPYFTKPFQTFLF